MWKLHDQKCIEAIETAERKVKNNRIYVVVILYPYVIVNEHTNNSLRK